MSAALVATLVILAILLLAAAIFCHKHVTTALARFVALFKKRDEGGIQPENLLNSLNRLNNLTYGESNPSL